MPPSAAAAARNFESLAEGELVALAQRGERGAFAGIMQRYNQRLFRVARSVVRDDHEAEDVLQEAYTRAFASFAGFRGESSLATWLTTITLNEARGRLRRRRDNVGLEAVEAAQQESGRVIIFLPLRKRKPGGRCGPRRDAPAARTRG